MQLGRRKAWTDSRGVLAEPGASSKDNSIFSGSQPRSRYAGVPKQVKRDTLWAASVISLPPAPAERAQAFGRALPRVSPCSHLRLRAAAVVGASCDGLK